MAHATWVHVLTTSITTYQASTNGEMKIFKIEVLDRLMIITVMADIVHFCVQKIPIIPI